MKRKRFGRWEVGEEGRKGGKKGGRMGGRGGGGMVEV